MALNCVPLDSNHLGNKTVVEAAGIIGVRVIYGLKEVDGYKIVLLHLFELFKEDTRVTSKSIKDKL